MSGAFGSEARKQALLQDLRDKGPMQKLWATQEAFDGDLSPVTREYDLHPAFVQMMPVLVEYGNSEHESFYLNALQALPVGANAATVVRRWFLFAWDEPTWGLSRALRDTPLLESAQAIIELVKASIAAPIDKGTWRAARNRLTATQEAAGLKVEQIDTVLSMAWNLDQVPGAARDVVGGWGAPIFFNAYAADAAALTRAEEELVMEHTRKAHEAAIAELGELTRDAEGFVAYERVTGAYWATEPEVAAIRQRQKAQFGRAKAKAAEWRKVAQQGLLDLLKTAPSSVAA